MPANCWKEISRDLVVSVVGMARWTPLTARKASPPTTRATRQNEVHPSQAAAGDRSGVAPGAPEPRPPAVAVRVYVPARRPDPGKGLVLAIDDDPNVVYLLKENLADAGYTVVSARSGEEGIQKARELQLEAWAGNVLWSDPDLARDRRFADSPLEEAGFELVCGFSCQVVVLV